MWYRRKSRMSYGISWKSLNITWPKEWVKPYHTRYHIWYHTVISRLTCDIIYAFYIIYDIEYITYDIIYDILVWHMISCMTFDFPSVGEDFFVVKDVEARAVEPQWDAAGGNGSDWSMDSDEARDYADRFQHLDDLDRGGRINDRNLEVLEVVLKVIPKCINEADFHRLSDLIPHQEPVCVPTRTVQEAIAVSFDTISYMISYDI